MPILPTTRLYWQDDHLFIADATFVAVREDRLALDQTLFYPGGGGQPPDEGWLRLPDDSTLEVISAQADADGVIWHLTCPMPPANLVGRSVGLMLNQARRLALMKYHTVLHVLNTVTLRDYGGWITGVQIGLDYSRIDFKLEGFSAALCAELERKVNAVLGEEHPLTAYFISEDEFRQRSDLLRTLEAQPPVVQGHVRVVEIEGFDAQACGGTQMHTTAEVGHFTILRTENKGRINKRLYIRLEP